MMVIMTIHSYGTIIILSIMVSTPFILAQPIKVPVKFDLLWSVPSMIKAIRSDDFNGVYNYVIKQSYIGTHVIGTVKNGQNVLIKGDPTALSRYVLVVPVGYGTRYVRVLTRFRGNNGTGYNGSVDEFVKYVWEQVYRRVIRTLINFEILSPVNSQYVKTEVFAGKRNGPDGVPESPECGDQKYSIHYSIKPEFWTTHSIGVVTYCGLVVEDKVDGLLEREVEWTNGLERPKIVVTSKYNNGIEVEKEYRLGGEGRFEIVNYRSKPVDLFG